MNRVKIHLFFAGVLMFAGMANAQVYQSKNMIFDISYGWPNLYTKIVKAAYNTGEYDVSLGSIGPAAVKFEYLISSKIGVGVHVNYATTYVKGTTEGFVPDQTQGKEYNYKASIRRIRFMPTFNLHLGKSEKLDPYFSFGIGYAGTTFKEKSDDPYITSVKLSNPWPLALRGEFGARYFFTNNMGIHLNVGLGAGALFNAGVSGRF